MKKITFLIFAFISTFTFAQVGISENFDSGTPAGWTDSYANTTTSPCAGNSERDNLWSSSTTGNLTSPNQVGASNGTDLTVSFDYKIIDYTGGTATAAGWGSAELQYSTDDGATWTTVLTIDDANHTASTDCANMSVTIPAASLPNGSDVKLQVANTWVAGDYYFYVDNFSATQVVNDPPTCDSVLSATADVAIEGDISWNAATGIPTGYNLTVGTTTGGSDILATTDVGNVTSYSLGTLSYSTTYYVTIQPYNGNGAATGCTEQTFVTEDAPPTGSLCSDPIVVGALPYNTSDDTANYGDDYSGSPGSSGCGSTFSYLNGDDVVYAYTATSDTSINIAISSLGGTYSGAFVYTDCADIGASCVAGYATGSSSSDFDFDLDVTNGTTYYIVISTWPSPQSVTYTLDITENTCTDATVTYTVVSDCDNSGGFFIDVEITDMGTATDITVSDDQGSASQAVTSASTVQFGPYVNATDVIFTIADDNDANCTQNSSSLTQAACPPENDDCSGAIMLTPGAAFDTNPVAGQTNLGATASEVADASIPAPACASYSGGDVWYAVTVPADGNLTIETNADPTGAGGDSGMAVYTGTCGALALFECDDDDSPDGTYSLVSIEAADGLANQTVYVRVWEYGNNATIDFQVSAYSATLSTNSFELNGFKYYPNPVNDMLSLEAQNNIQNVSVYNMLGQEVVRISPNMVETQVDMSALQVGAYFVKVTINNATKTIKVLKK